MKRSHFAFAFVLFPFLSWSQAAQPDFGSAQDDAVTFLRDLVRMDTSDPPGNESQAAHYIQRVFQKEGVSAEILEPVTGRGSVVARLKGDGSKKPLLLMGHTDVVPVDRAYWTIDPFGGNEKNGILFGRGALDDKGFVAANMEVLLLLHRLKIPLTRDVIFLAEASEEAPSAAGMKALVDKYWDKLTCEYALNEGGAALVEDGKVKYMGVGAAEKLPRSIILRATGSSGHGSVPLPDNAVVHLAAAVAKVGTWQTPTRLNEVTREFFRRLASISQPEEAAWYRNIEDPAVQEQLRLKKPRYYSMLRTSVVPTMLKAGFKINVIPPTAEATLDVRALPDEDLAKLRELFANLINDSQVQVVPANDPFMMVPSPASSLHTEMFNALEQAQRLVFPNAITLPFMATGATDASFLRAKGVQAYGLHVPRTEEENRTAHGNDERVELKQFGSFIRYLYAVVQQVASN
jgi:acetylornithine deacetylase/succinyl-diaminopimelate desuccinylase-like protein